MSIFQICFVGGIAKLRYQKADVCLYFNYPRYRCYWRVFKRLFYKDIRIQDPAPYCPSWSLLTYMWGFENRVNPILNRLQKTYPTVHFIEVRGENDLKEVQKNIIGKIYKRS